MPAFIGGQSPAGAGFHITNLDLNAGNYGARWIVDSALQARAHALGINGAHHCQKKQQRSKSSFHNHPNYTKR